MTFDTLKDISCENLRFYFDVTLLHKTVMIEVNGCQHYKIVKSHKSQDSIEKNYCNTIIHDSLKSLYCEL